MCQSPFATASSHFVPFTLPVQAKLMQVDHGPRYFSTQPTVFAVPELLQLIFVELHDEEKDLLNAAVVCSAWKSWALETRWGHCRVELRHLLALLGPVKLTHVSLAHSVCSDSGFYISSFHSERLRNGGKRSLITDTILLSNYFALSPLF